MKAVITIFLLFIISLLISIYYSFGESKNEIAAYIAIPVVIEALLIFIFFFSTRDSKYRKTFKVILIIWSVIFLLAMILLGYLTALSGSFNH